MPEENKYKGKRTVKVRGVCLGEGICKICVPVVEQTDQAIITAAEKAAHSRADIMEWRADYYPQVCDRERVASLLTRIREAIGQLPLIVTYRTKAEGGAASAELSDEAYMEFCRNVLMSGQADILDVEMSKGEDAVRELGSTAHGQGKFVLTSFHDFQKTPPADELAARYQKMDKWGADIRKIAVMPRRESDVQELLSVCEHVSASGSPVIAISMGSMGLESRVCGEMYGCAATFGCLEHNSAPGQVPADELADLLADIHSMCR